MVKLVFEDVYKPGYDPKLKLKTFNEYFSKIPNNNSTYVKMINFAGNVTICNVTDVEASENVANPATISEKNPAAIHIIYSDSSSSKPCTAKKFASMCKKCFDALKDVDPEHVNIALRQDGKIKTDRFRFYYDDDTNCAILARNVSGAQKITDYIQAHINDFKEATTDTKPVKLEDKVDK